MFPAEKDGEFEPYKIRRRQDKPVEKQVEQNGEAQGEAKPIRLRTELHNALA